MKTIIIAIFLGLVLLFGCIGQTSVKDVNAKDDSGKTLLVNAVINNQYDTAKTLINAGARVNEKIGVSNYTALHYAVSNIHITDTKMIELLLDNGADVNATTYDGRTPLFLIYDINVIRISKYAGFYENVGITDDILLHEIDLLIQNGADVNAKYYGKTVLMEAIRIDSFVSEGINIKFIKKLISNGADVNFKDVNGRTALSMAKQQLCNPARDYSYTEIMKVLEQAGATE